MVFPELLDQGQEPARTLGNLGVSENRGASYSTLNIRILIIRTPNEVSPNFRKLPFRVWGFGFKVTSSSQFVVASWRVILYTNVGLGALS